ncbi:fibronectin type III domain-containing protein [Actinomadura sp. WAC 06369]|uniref:fibronectin type III domain-containing protein n=1 Tax=Actinomadura sp. WAC 06369 TaxID=2203193 RepID=UPI000F7B743F|nr:fibronectin type III domain-containing protein [Actinomadura sp. WAC 06369]RSN47015.1 hypothetical protein DMH08_34685 [Actinomadura sp. WAC 06369]
MGGGRSPGRTGKPHGIIRYFGRDRLTGQAAIALAGVLVVGALVYGVGAASARYRLSDVGAWLGASAKGLVVHANGPAGKVDGRAELPARMRGHRIEVVQDGTTVLLVDTDTGVVSRIDPAQLEITGSRGLGGPGLQVAVGGGAAYTVDLVKGVVQRIDPVSLAPLGAAATLAAPLGQAGIDGRGALWVPVPQDGRVVPFHGGGPGTPVDVGEPGATLSLTIAAGTPVVVDSTSATAHVVRPEGVQAIRLPAAVAGTRGGVKLPAATDGGVVPMLGAGGSLHLLDTGVGRVESVALRVPDHEFAPPHILGSRVYLPDRTSGRLLVFDTAAGAWREPVAATRPGGAVEALVRDHMLWFNDPDGAFALAFTAPQPQGVRPVTGFALLDAAGRPVAGASPRTHPGTATEGAFTVGGLTCDSTTHVFKVAAVYEDASGKTKFSPSGEVGAAACQAPPPAAGLRAEPVDHGARLTWDASPGHDVTYTVTTPAGTVETESTSATVGGLRNNARHQVTVTARNGAGTSTPVATTVDLAYPTRQFQNQNNGQTNTIIRSTPGTGGGQNGKIPKDRIVTMTVVCQVRGEPYTDPESGSSSDVWNQVRTPHGDGYLNDTLVRTTKGRGFPSDGLFECEG